LLPLTQINRIIKLIDIAPRTRADEFADVERGVEGLCVREDEGYEGDVEGDG